MILYLFILLFAVPPLYIYIFSNFLYFYFPRENRHEEFSFSYNTIKKNLLLYIFCDFYFYVLYVAGHIAYGLRSKKLGN